VAIASAIWPARAVAHEPITTKVRFNKEIVRILERSCLGCHRAGGIAPFSLVTYEEARPWAKAIKEELLEKRMPPWPVVKGYGEFRNAPTLTGRERDLIVNWVEGGAPKGEDKDLPTGPLFSDDWPLGKPDLILKPDADYRVAADADEHRSFTLATNLKGDRWVTAIDLRPGDGSVVHSASVHFELPSKISNSKISNSKFEIPKFTWVPGSKPLALPDGVAQLLPAGARVILKIHYRGSGEAVKDRSAVGLYFAKTLPRKQLREVVITNTDAVRAVVRTPQQVKASYTVEQDAEAIAIRPYVHPMLVSLQATALRPDGTEEVLIWTRDYRYDWQWTYHFKRAIALPKGTRVEVIAYFDNSPAGMNNAATPKPAHWSELTPDPLCALIIATPPLSPLVQTSDKR
jgi:hypothetical protein